MPATVLGLVAWHSTPESGQPQLSRCLAGYLTYTAAAGIPYHAQRPSFCQLTQASTPKDSHINLLMYRSMRMPHIRALLGDMWTPTWIIRTISWVIRQANSGSPPSVPDLEKCQITPARGWSRPKISAPSMP